MIRFLVLNEYIICRVRVNSAHLCHMTFFYPTEKIIKENKYKPRGKWEKWLCFYSEVFCFCYIA